MTMRYLLAALLALLPLPALADVTARYSAGKDVLLIEIDDDGNSRIGIDGKFGIIRRDGVDYAVLSRPEGDTKVVELAELLTILSSVMTSTPTPDAMAVEKFVLAAKGEAMVGGRKGILWNFGPEKEADGRPGDMLEIVISDDPALAPVAAIIRRTVELLLPVFGAMIPESSGFAGQASALTSKGAPLRVDKMIELQSVETGEIDPRRFELPAPVISAAEFMQSAGPPPAIEVKPLP
jgi:hypothetical protein